MAFCYWVTGIARNAENATNAAIRVRVEPERAVALSDKLILGSTPRQDSTKSTAAWVSGSGLHNGCPLTAAMTILVLAVRIRIWFSGVFLIFQGLLLTFTKPSCRSSGVCGGPLTNVLFIRHRKSFRDGHGIQPPGYRSVA